MLGRTTMKFFFAVHDFFFCCSQNIFSASMRFFFDDDEIFFNLFSNIYSIFFRGDL